MISVISAFTGLAAGPTLNVCTNRTCKKMGSADTVELLTALASMAPTQPTPGIAAAGFSPGSGCSPAKISGETPSGAARLWHIRQRAR